MDEWYYNIDCGMQIKYMSHAENNIHGRDRQEMEDVVSTNSQNTIKFIKAKYIRAKLQITISGFGDIIY